MSFNTDRLRIRQMRLSDIDAVSAFKSDYESPIYMAISHIGRSMKAEEGFNAG